MDIPITAGTLVLAALAFLIAVRLGLRGVTITGS